MRCQYIDLIDTPAIDRESGCVQLFTSEMWHSAKETMKGEKWDHPSDKRGRRRHDRRSVRASGRSVFHSFFRFVRSHSLPRTTSGESEQASKRRRLTHVRGGGFRFEPVPSPRLLATIIARE